MGQTAGGRGRKKIKKPPREMRSGQWRCGAPSSRRLPHHGSAQHPTIRRRYRANERKCACTPSSEHDTAPFFPSRLPGEVPRGCNADIGVACESFVSFESLGTVRSLWGVALSALGPSRRIVHLLHYSRKTFFYYPCSLKINTNFGNSCMIVLL